MITFVCSMILAVALPLYAAFVGYMLARNQLVYRVRMDIIESSDPRWYEKLHSLPEYDTMLWQLRTFSWSTDGSDAEEARDSTI